jgi:putative glutamine amidotransferase
MTKKIIGISSNITINNSKPFNGSKQLRLFYEYVQSVIAAGGIPIILPNTTDLLVIDSHINIIDGLILTGGSDINPLKYGEEPKEKLGHVSNERDFFELYLLEQAMKNNIPVLGICRGHQVVNVFNGGSLYQDISYIKGSYIKHIQDSEPYIPSHSISISKDSVLYKILGDNALVNSYHHLAVKDLAPNFKISAISKDGVIEAIESTMEPLIIGIQWHPELLTKNYYNMLNLFKYFIEKC